MQMQRVKVSISLEEKVLDKVETYAKSLGVSRTAAVSFLIAQGLQVACYPEMLEKLGEIVKIKAD